MARADFYTNTNRMDEIYSDFFTDLNPHPDSKDLVRYANENAVKKSIKNLMLTNKLERLFQPNLGSNISKFLFEPMIGATAIALKQSIVETIINHEPRCKLLDVRVDPDEVNNAYNVTIVFMIINKQDPISLDISLYRVR